MLSFECIKNEKSVYFLLTSAQRNKKPAGSQYKPTKSKWAYPVYIKKNQRELAEKLAQREITEMNLKNAGLRTG